MDESVRVLTVDDEPDFASMTGTFLERAAGEFDVSTANGAEEALDRLANDSFDCVVSDYDMPGKNGIELLEAVREDHPELPFILFTGKGSEEVASDAISAGVTDYLQKGVGSDQYAVLANRIRNAVEHHRTSRKVERSEQRLRRIVDALPHPLYVADREGTYLLANETLAAFHDTTVDDVEGAHVGSVLDEEATERFLDHLETVLEDGEPLRVPTVEIDDPAGETHVFEPRLLPYDLAEGEDRAVLGIATDVTDRIQRERRLNALVERLEGLHDATRDLVRADDRAAVADVVTAAVRDIFEYSSSVVRLREGNSLVPVAVTDRVREDLGERPTYGLDEGFPGEVYRSGESKIVEDFQEIEDVEESVDPSPHRSALYVPIGEHGTLTIGHTEPDAFDRSDRSLARVLVDNVATVLDRLEGEGELTRHHDRLETIVGVASHDLRNQLDAARSRVDLASEECESDHLAPALRAHDHMAAILEDTLALARAGTQVAETSTVELAPLVEACWASIDHGTADLVVETEATVTADEARLRQLLDHLLRNALEHGSASPERAQDAVEYGDGDVTVRVGDLPTGFFVADDGPGIPSADRDRVFETGYSTKGSETGFGLAIVEAVAAAHDWSVAVATGEDGGARIEVTGVEPG